MAGKPEAELECEGLNFSRGDLISCVTDFSRLCFTGMVCALFAAVEAQRDHSDSCPEKRLWFVGFSAAVVSL